MPWFRSYRLRSFRFIFQEFVNLFSLLLTTAANFHPYLIDVVLNSSNCQMFLNNGLPSVNQGPCFFSRRYNRSQTALQSLIEPTHWQWGCCGCYGNRWVLTASLTHYGLSSRMHTHKHAQRHTRAPVNCRVSLPLAHTHWKTQNTFPLLPRSLPVFPCFHGCGTHWHLVITSRAMDY